jgi:hypothetical protein
MLRSVALLDLWVLLEFVSAIVVAASALNILKSVDNRITSAADIAETSPWVIFSAVINGLTHASWVHYNTGSEYHMYCLESCRTTLPGDGEQFAESLDGYEGGEQATSDEALQRVGTLRTSMCAPGKW